MLQNKRFIGLLIFLLVFVVGYNIRYFLNKGSDLVPDLEEELEDTMDRALSGGLDPEDGMTVKIGERSFPSQGPLKAPLIQLASIEELMVSLPSFVPDGMRRNPFLTEKEAAVYRKKLKKKRRSGKAAEVDQSTVPPISRSSIKMIYRLGDKAYVWIRGRAWQEGATIGEARILKINEDSILLERSGVEKTLFMNREGVGQGKNVQINYEE